MAILPSMPPPPAHWTSAADLSPPSVPSSKYIYVFGRPINQVCLLSTYINSKKALPYVCALKIVFLTIIFCFIFSDL